MASSQVLVLWLPSCRSIFTFSEPGWCPFASKIANSWDVRVIPFSWTSRGPPTAAEHRTPRHCLVSQIPSLCAAGVHYGLPWAHQCKRSVFLRFPFYPTPEGSLLYFVPVPLTHHQQISGDPPSVSSFHSHVSHKLQNCSSRESFLNPLRFFFLTSVISLAPINSEKCPAGLNLSYIPTHPQKSV